MILLYLCNTLLELLHLLVTKYLFPLLYLYLIYIWVVLSLFFDCYILCFKDDLYKCQKSQSQFLQSRVTSSFHTKVTML